MKIEEKEVKTIQDFIEYTDRYKNENKIRLYRGQMEMKNWVLESKLFRLVERQNRINDFYTIEKRIFNKFKEHLIQNDIKSSKLNDWEILSIGQHYGLPTRLIDWTKNPLVALWFAFEKEKGNMDDRLVWGLVVDEEHRADLEKDDPFSDELLRVFEPNKIDPRIVCQQSWFSVQNINTFSNKGKGDGLPVFNDDCIMNEMEDFEFNLIRIRIGNDRNTILRELDNLGINHSTIFLDLQGVCKHIEWDAFE